MTFEEFRFEMNEFRDHADRMSLEFKDQSIVREKMLRLYKGFKGEEIDFANLVILEWVCSDRDTVRYDALSLVSDLKLRCGLPEMENLLNVLTKISGPDAEYEMKKVQRIIDTIKE